MCAVCGGESSVSSVWAPDEGVCWRCHLWAMAVIDPQRFDALTKDESLVVLLPEERLR